MVEPAAGRERLRLAFFSPLPPARSGIADYSAALLPHLGRLADITLFAPEPAAVEGALRARFPVEPLSAYPARRWAFDAALFHLGNSSHHAELYRLFCRHPGLVVLHDLVLHHFLAQETAGQGDFPAYARELAYNLGRAGERLALAIRFGGKPHPLFELPLNRRVLDLSLGTIVHSQYAARCLARQTAGPVQVVPALAESPLAPSRRQQLPLPPGSLLFGSFGQVTAAKQMPLALGAFARLRQHLPQVHFVIAGESHPEVDLPRLLRELGLEGAVTLLGHLDDLAAFAGWIGSVDVVVNLRWPSAGETSATALRALAAGRPLIVFDHGWYAELPGEVAWKVPPGDGQALLAAMQSLAQEPRRREQMGQAAQAYVRRRHGGPAVAAAYLAFVRRVLEQLDA